jgi:hypothetical protein
LLKANVLGYLEPGQMAKNYYNTDNTILSFKRIKRKKTQLKIFNNKSSSNNNNNKSSSSSHNNNNNTNQCNVILKTS